MRSPVRPAFAFLFLCVAVPLAAAQVALPPSTSKSRGNLAPHHVCSVCGARNYSVPSNARVGEDGQPIAYCATCKKETAHTGGASEPGLHAPQGSGSGATGTGGLRIPPGGEVPGRGAKPDAPSNPAPNSGANAPAPAPQAPQSAPAGGAKLADGPAAFVFQELTRLETTDDPLVGKAVDTLASMGEAGLAAARAELASERPARLFVAARVLLAGGAGADVDLVLVRASAKLPTVVCTPLAEALAKADPVRASPAWFAEALAHPTGAMRVACERVLRRELGPALVPVLVPVLASKRPEVRHLALGLLADVDDPAAVDRLFAHLADPRASVAQIAVHALASRPGADIDARLLSRAFGQRWILRDEAYALLAIVEREERTLHPLIDERHVDALLGGLQASDRFVSGTCAAALAGIGFRSAHPRDTAWLDQQVVDSLVVVVSGRVFHDDLSSLTGTAAARLQLVSGQELGQDGPKWIEWWLSARDGHVARRAWIEVAPGDEDALLVRWRADGDAALLIGPAAKAPVAASTGRVAESVVHLTEAETRGLLAVFQKEGLFGPEKLPGARGRRGAGERALELTVAGRGKAFQVGEDAREPWFERAAAAVSAARERNRWQRFAPPDRSQYSFWQEQSPWWSLEHTPAERAVRSKALVFAAITGQRPSEREAGIQELVRIYVEPEARDASDFDAFLVL
ncbi:MAG: hypothetical protein HZA53_10440, partial [Planctomycetes bacterium]|nr:hypothetical protein [Planctomycetota bacterium]